MSDVRVSGPLFDGTLLRRCQDGILEKVGQRGVDEIRNRLPEVYDKDPFTATGHYESTIHTERQMDDRLIITDGTVYGPWLEGVGSRNFPKTRFRGYHTFRLISQRLDGEAQAIADEAVKRVIEEEK